MGNFSSLIPAGRQTYNNAPQFKRNENIILTNNPDVRSRKDNPR
jgi:hypothetical protein